VGIAEDLRAHTPGGTACRSHHGEGLETIVPISAISSWYDYSKVTLPAVVSGTPPQAKTFSTEQSWRRPGPRGPPRQPRLFY
jgi:hypothetical protein